VTTQRLVGHLCNGLFCFDLQLIAVVVIAATAFSWTSSSSASADAGGGDDFASVATDGGTEKLRLRREEPCKYRRNCVLKCNIEVVIVVVEAGCVRFFMLMKKSSTLNPPLRHRRFLYLLLLAPSTITAPLSSCFLYS